MAPGVESGLVIPPKPEDLAAFRENFLYRDQAFLVDRVTAVESEEKRLRADFKKLARLGPPSSSRAVNCAYEPGNVGSFCAWSSSSGNTAISCITETRPRCS